MPGNAQLLLLDRDALAAIMTTDMVSRAVYDAFTLHGQRQGRVFPVVREALKTGGIFGIKSGDVAARALLGFKAAGFWPRNRELGGEPHQATITLFDPMTGRPSCIMDGNAITTARTAAAGELGLRVLARADSTSLCVFGTGVQARAQLSAALRALPSLRMVRYVSHDGKPDTSFENHFNSLCRPTLAADANAAVADSDVVITATPGGGPLFSLEAVRPGTHFNCIGADTRGKRELPEGLLDLCRLVADDHEQATSLGEAQWSPSVPHMELGHIVTGKSEFIRHTDDVTVFDMTGLALQDLVVGEYLYDAACHAGLGRLIPWPW
ncbi:ornithine cyclodeaminase family protein [Massilia cavernae]|uniref:Ornithine cyclodeaminase family protein n=1 Tax=Massilia cavernae TaxID=2320864 RepID=A0A418Y5W1_9BURK|nr:ornithine cyclodeaminase family protein [Massilia cavernae]RJG22375.1 ornithine cyclodeaminase family protein [Massilia cavernae]